VTDSSDPAPGRWARRKAARASKRAARADDELVTAAVLPTEAEARLAAGSLENNGIPAAVQLDQPVFASTWAEAARVIVRRRDLDRARHLLEDPDP
jgi:hypothetical protein